MIVVSNSGPLMALGKVAALDILRAIYGEVLLPTAVFDEVVIQGLSSGNQDAIAARSAIAQGYLRVIEIRDSDVTPQVWKLPLDRGEKQAIHMALRDSADFVLLDDSKARSEAKSLGFKVKGTLGVIVQAHRTSYLSKADAESLIDTIIARPDIWISEELCKQVRSRL